MKLERLEYPWGEVYLALANKEDLLSIYVRREGSIGFTDHRLPTEEILDLLLGEVSEGRLPEKCLVHYLHRIDRENHEQRRALALEDQRLREVQWRVGKALDRLRLVSKVKQ